jgi:DNA-binding transcriptional ArsR family regulator
LVRAHRVALRARTACAARVLLPPPAARLTAVDQTLYFPYWLINYLGKYGERMTLTLADDQLSETFAALANSTRRAILARLARGEATVNELAAPFNMTLPAISKHIKVLERAGLIVRGQRAQYRPCAIDASRLEEISAWAEQYRPVWEARFERMDDYVRQLRPQRKADEHHG